ncbi:transcription initiation factor TFIID subunit 9 [Skeletonema marinoi]|uniref:Transcription initiation factor TFIID subunit 9 n=1 Tax=Skeletonema marinoi TaxID=267567 RepID=A0AAD8Y654_9STRA|nr:transcription initiation factor TFIID subunit 9 [Skeletonema marinoi]
MAANPTAAPPTTAATTTSSTNNPTPSISPIKKTTSSSNKSPTSSKSKHSSSDHVKFTSTTSKKSPTKKSSTTSSTAATEKQLKLQKAEIAKPAFRQDVEVWAGPSNVVFPRRYHSLMQLKQTNSNNSSSGGGGGGNTKKKENRNGKGNEVYYGSQSQGWMYGDGFARMGGLSWMDSDAANTATQQPQSSSSSSSSGFLMDDVSIIDKSLHSAGLTRSHLTPRAYACLLEQARRYTLELLADAQDYALHAQRSGSGDNSSMIAALQPSDLLLAVEMREDTNVCGRGGESGTVAKYTEECYGGVVLPPVEEQLTARTFDVVNGARVVQRMMRGGDYPMGLSEVGNLGKKGGGSGGRKTGSYGAATGRQISVNLKSGKVIDEKSKSGGSSVVGGGSAASAPAASKTSSGSKGQKRRLTEL